MALINCPECSHEISDKVKACPYCGYPFPEPEAAQPVLPQKVEVTNVNIKASKKTKLFFILIIALILLSSISFFVVKTLKKKDENKEYNKYINNLNVSILAMQIGGTTAELQCNLTLEVWQNAIYKKNSTTTNKYTMKSGYFVSDFNTALANLYSDSNTLTTLSNIKKNQKSVQDVLKKLQNPPKGLEKCYDSVTELYATYKSLTDLAVSPTGSLTTYSQNKSTKISEFNEKYEKLKTQIPNKKK